MPSQIAEARSPRKIRIPALVGLSVDQATKALQRAGFRMRLVGNNRGYGKRVVHGQHPSAGTPMVRGATVRVSFRYVATPRRPRRVIPPSKGRPPRHQPQTVVVPDLRGLAPHVARNLLRARGLRAQFPAGLPRRGVLATVSHQSLKPGTAARRGAVLRIDWRRTHTR